MVLPWMSPETLRRWGVCFVLFLPWRGPLVARALLVGGFPSLVLVNLVVIALFGIGQHVLYLVRPVPTHRLKVGR